MGVQVLKSYTPSLHDVPKSMRPAPDETDRCLKLVILTLHFEARKYSSFDVIFCANRY